MHSYLNSLLSQRNPFRTTMVDTAQIKAKVHLNKAGKYAGNYMFYANLGDVYKELKQYPKAEAAYLHSAYMVPHKLYPHYLLAKLDMQSGDTIKAIVKAKEVLAMDAKVNSMAENK